MREYLIGTGGWAYFQVPGLHPLIAYSKVFNFVELNSTFYQIPPLEEVERWRSLVPRNFQFAVRGNRAITHKHKLQPTQEAFEVFEKMKQICLVLKSDILHLQTPPSIRNSDAFAHDLCAFLSSIKLGNLRIALETRGFNNSMLTSELVKTMQDYNIIHSVDLSKGEMPAYKSDILYSRLFGKGFHNVYQPTDEELLDIDKRASSGNSQKIVMSFHFVRMYKDAARLKTYKQTGRFPKVTRSTGFASLEEVLKEDAHFPATRQELVKDQGWKLFDLTEDRRMRAEEFLQRLPDRIYNNINEILDALKPLTR